MTHQMQMTLFGQSECPVVSVVSAAINSMKAAAANASSTVTAPFDWTQMLTPAKRVSKSEASTEGISSDVLTITFDEFKEQYKPLLKGGHVCEGYYIDRSKMRYMEIASAAHDNRIFSVTYKDSDPVIKSGWNPLANGYIVTEAETEKKVIFVTY